MPFFGPWPAAVVDELHVHTPSGLAEVLPERSPEPLQHRLMADFVLDEKTCQRIEAVAITDLAREHEQRERLRRLFKCPSEPR